MKRSKGSSFNADASVLATAESAFDARRLIGIHKRLKHMIRLNICLLILFISFKALAQTTPVTWRSESVTDLRNNEETPFACEFIIYPNDRIEWLQDQYTESYSIASTEGSFPQAGPGTIAYDVTKEGVSGKVTIQRAENGDVTLILDLSKDTQLGAYFRFKVFNP